ncbi:MAG TPA: hypothetical protein VGM08_04465 [Candidatus Saccharimonadales bacterium]|jgi:hypothetical protein
MPRTAEPKAGAASLDTLISRIAADYPGFAFVEGARFSWRADKRHVSFRKSAADTERGAWALLHELGHALLGHADYRYDIELLQMEAAAWTKARQLAAAYGLQIDGDYVQDCLDTYRDWLHLRATCPTCYARSLQASPRAYRCHNCGTGWQVSRNRLCRPYRLKTT